MVVDYPCGVPKNRERDVLTAAARFDGWFSHDQVRMTFDTWTRPCPETVLRHLRTFRRDGLLVERIVSGYQKRPEFRWIED